MGFPFPKELVKITDVANVASFYDAYFMVEQPIKVDRYPKNAYDGVRI